MTAPAPALSPFRMRMSALPCPRCLELSRDGLIRVETVQPLAAGTLARDGSGPCCHDCAAADLLVRIGHAPNFLAARITTGTERQEQYHAPGVAVGLVLEGIMRPSGPTDFAEHLAWLDENNWFEYDETS